ncbi:M48 family metalloprotease [Nonomuraea wenchangensis]
MAVHDAQPPELHSVPSGTTLRFLVLILAMVVAGVPLLDAVLFPAELSRKLADCWLERGFDFTDPSGNLLVEVAALSDTGCPTTEAGVPYWRGLLAMTAVLPAAFALYWWLPRWRSRRGRMVELSAVDENGVIRDRLQLLVERSGLSAAPAFMVDTTSFGVNAVVIGRPKARIVSLHAGLLPLCARAPERFDAVVLHELAHIRSRDADIAYAVVALWRTFLALVVAPYLILDAVPTLVAWLRVSEERGEMRAMTLSWTVTEVAKVLFLVLLVRLAQAGTLRHRELSADAAAAAAGAERRVWADAAAAEGRTPALTRLWRAHPTWRRRHAALARPEVLFRPSPTQLFLLGWTATVLGVPLTRFGDGTLTVWPVAVPIALIITFAVWRSLLHAGAGKEHGPGWLPSGLAFGAGLAAGDLLAGRLGVGEWVPPQWPVLLVLLPAAVMYVRWVELCSMLQLRLGWRRRRALWLPALGASLLAVAAVRWWALVGATYARGMDFASGTLAETMAADAPETWSGHRAELMVLAHTRMLFLSVGFTAVDLAAAVVFLALPLALWMWRRGSRRWTIAVAGTTGGLAIVAAVLGVLVHLRSWDWPASENGLPPILIHQSSASLVAWVGLAVLAMIVTVLARTDRLLAVLLATGLAQLVTVAGYFAFLVAGGCFGPAGGAGVGCPPGFGWSLLGQFARAVAPAAYGAAMVAVLLGPLAARIRRADPRPWAGRIVSAAAVAAAAAMVAVAGRAVFAGPPAGVAAPPAPSPAAKVSDQEFAWWSTGTKTAHAALVADYRRYFAVRPAMVRFDELTRAESAELRSLCESLGPDADRARNAGPYPEPVLRRALNAALDQATAAGQACLDWLAAPPNSYALAKQALNTLDQGAQSLTPVLTAILERRNAPEKSPTGRVPSPSPH